MIELTGKKYYVLSMFPYPSGKLHMGHVRVYTISDMMARYQRLLGKQVIHPMGWDAFGLPAENAAIEKGELPHRWTESNIENMRKQLDDLCCSFDWDREIATCDPDYYQWTQHIFLKMFEAGLVYQKQATVNWDPVDQTVLADEQIDEEGKSWRSGAKVEKKYLLQWYIKATAYSKSLADGLDEVDPSLWQDIIKLQKHWIGDCVGTKLDFKMEVDGVLLAEPINVYLAEPELICGVSHIALHHEHPLNKKDYYKTVIGTGEEEEILLTVCAINPINNTKIPLIVSKRTEFSEYTDNKIGIPCSDPEDLSLAERFSLQFENVLEAGPDGSQVLSNSNQFSGMPMSEAFRAVMDYAKKNAFGGHLTSERLKDWLISRQRYWGTPIPIIHCPNCKAVPVPFEDLPVKLPMIEQFSGKGASPLAQNKDWHEVKCPKCGTDALRETDTMDTFVDSSWYFLRYLDPDNQVELCSKEKARSLMPVDLYIGGKEHATLHLYFARFFNHFLYDQGIVNHKEPFVNLLTQGMVMGESYRSKDGRYLRKEEVDFSGDKPVVLDTGDPVIVDWEKMSKSKYNGVDPQEVLERYGIDSTRLCILAGVAPKSNRKFSSDIETFSGVLNWQRKIWAMVTKFINLRKGSEEILEGELSEQDEQIYKSRNFHLIEVNGHFSKTFLINAGISRLQSYSNYLMKLPDYVVQRSALFEQALCDLVIMLSPMVPMFASELWAGLSSIQSKSGDYNWDVCLLDQAWPKVDAGYHINMMVTVNRKDFTQVLVPFYDLDKLTPEMALHFCESDEKYRTKCAGKVKNIKLYVKPGWKANINLSVPELVEKRAKKTKKVEEEKIAAS
ncbi:probable leucine--tRNA ligase, mitochondrial isoform X2 [Lineus longissimus]|uniref:probable leucine--tRNA ligase, mitochondrial isoform X2 n=1 Tax=Lineus longissimus TaxID=88925 RepID=UPI00315D7052